MFGHCGHRLRGFCIDQNGFSCEVLLNDHDLEVAKGVDIVENALAEIEQETLKIREKRLF